MLINNVQNNIFNQIKENFYSFGNKNIILKLFKYFKTNNMTFNLW